MHFAFHLMGGGRLGHSSLSHQAFINFVHQVLRLILRKNFAGKSAHDLKDSTTYLQTKYKSYTFNENPGLHNQCIQGFDNPGFLTKLNPFNTETKTTRIV